MALLYAEVKRFQKMGVHLHKDSAGSSINIIQYKTL